MNAEQIDRCIENLERRGFRVGSRCGELTEVDYRWRNDEWLEKFGSENKPELAR